MSKTLYIFTATGRPDVYLNAIAHCVLQRDVSAVELLHIKGLSVKSGSDGERVSLKIDTNLKGLLGGLKDRAVYTHFDASGRYVGETDLANCYSLGEVAAIKEYYAHVFARMRNCRPADHDMEYKDLGSWFRRVARSDGSMLIDISAIKKRYVGDVVAAALVEGITGIYTVDPVSPENFERPWESLLHHLPVMGGKSGKGKQEAYSYVNILDTEVYRQYRRVVLVRAPRFRLAMTITVVALVIAGLAAFFADGEAAWLRVFSGVTSTASIISLIFVLWPPRHHG